MQTIRLVVLSMVVSAPTVFADQITLRNGDRMSGTIITSDAKTLAIETEYADIVTIKWDFVQQIESSESLYVGTKGGQVIVGPVTTNDNKLAVTTKESGSVAVAKADVTSIRNADEEKKAETALDRVQHPRVADLWAGTLDTGLGLVRGNSESSNFTFGLNAVRATDDLHAGLGQAEVLDLSLADELLDGAGHILDGHLRIHTMLIQKVDAVGPQALQRRVDHAADVLGAAVQPLPGVTVVKSELRCDHDLIAHRRERFADHAFVDVWTIGLGTVEKGHAAVKGCTDQLHSVCRVGGGAIAEAQPHAAQTERRDGQAAAAELSFLHVVFFRCGVSELTRER